MSFKNYAEKARLKEDSYAEEVSKYFWNVAIEEAIEILPECNCAGKKFLDLKDMHNSISCPQYWANKIRKKKVE